MNIPILDKDWKQHPTYKNYWFCIDGRVLSTSKKTPKILKGTLCGQQKYIAIPVDGSKKIYVHRTVCELFNGPAPNEKQCRHLDGNKYNNHASNLMWGTVKENSHDKFVHGTVLFGEKKFNGKTNKKPSFIDERNQTKT